MAQELKAIPHQKLVICVKDTEKLELNKAFLQLKELALNVKGLDTLLKTHVKTVPEQPPAHAPQRVPARQILLAIQTPQAVRTCQTLQMDGRGCGILLRVESSRLV